MKLYEFAQDKRYYTATYGCQMNEHDSEVLAGMLEQIGFQKADSEDDCDLLIINTCAVREKAEQKILSKIGALKSYKEQKPNMIIAVGGCMVQQEHVANKIYRDFPHVDLIFGTHNMPQFPALLDRAITQQQRVKALEFDDTKVFENLPHKRGDAVKAWVVISYGCDNYCKYCIVPYVRGRKRSRKIDQIRKEVEQLALQGYKEITLLGQNVNAYGKDLGMNNGFVALLEEVEKISGIERIRFMTSHPRDFDPKLAQLMANSNKICEHVHLPIQSGSDKILKKMGRGYTREHYMKIVNQIKNYVPSVSITTDIIVGYPGETEDDFEETLDLVNMIEFDSAFTFAFSKRSGTPAAGMDEQVDEKTKKRRLQRLIDLQQHISKKKNKALEGTYQTILVEGVSKSNKDILSGRTRTDKLVHFSGSKDLIGQFVDVYITHAKAWTIYGELFPKPARQMN